MFFVRFDFVLLKAVEGNCGKKPEGSNQLGEVVFCCRFLVCAGAVLLK